MFTVTGTALTASSPLGGQLLASVAPPGLVICDGRDRWILDGPGTLVETVAPPAPCDSVLYVPPPAGSGAGTATLTAVFEAFVIGTPPPPIVGSATITIQP